MSKHTPTPWAVIASRDGAWVREASALHDTIATFVRKDTMDRPLAERGTKSQARIDAEFVVRAANAHDELLAACRALTEWWGHLAKDTRLPNHDIALEGIRAARAAIAKAEGDAK